MRRSIAGLLLLGCWSSCFAEPPLSFNATVQADFAELQTALQEAISEQGFTVSQVGNIGQMLERTGKDLGEHKMLYRHAVYIAFCSAKYTRLMAEANPDYVHFCPFKITLYSLPDEARTVHLYYQLPDLVPEQNPWLVSFATVLQALVKQAIELGED